MKKEKTFSHYFKPFATLDGRIDFHYLTKDKKFGYTVGVVIDKKKEWEIYISPKGNKVKVFKNKFK